MRIFHFFLRSFNCFSSGSWTEIGTNFYCNCLLGTPLKFYKYNLVRSFLIHHSLFKNKLWVKNTEDEDNIEKKKKILPKVSVISERNETVMTLAEAEKYAKKNKMLLVPVEGSRKERMKYKLVKRVVDIIEDKKIQDSKKIILREGIAAHDLEIKINQMLNFVNKGLKVVSFIEGSSGGEKMKNVLSKLEESKLNEFFVEKHKKARGVQLVYQGKAHTKEEKS